MFRHFLTLIVVMSIATPVLAQGRYRQPRRQVYQPAYQSSQPSDQSPQYPEQYGQSSPGSGLPPGSTQNFNQGNSMPGGGRRPARGRKSASELSAEVDRLVGQVKQAKANGNTAAMAEANVAMQNVLHELCTVEPQNAKWRILRATTFMNQASTPAAGGFVKGDGMSWILAMKDLEFALTCPNASQYSSEINMLRPKCQQGLKKHHATIGDLMRKNDQAVMKLPAWARQAPGGATCSNCHHWKESADIRCGYCGF